MRLGLKRGFTVPRVVLNGYEGTITRTSWTPPKERFLEAVRAFPAANS